MTLAETKVARLNPLLRALTILGLAALSCNLPISSKDDQATPTPVPPLPCGNSEVYPISPGFSPRLSQHPIDIPDQKPGCFVRVFDDPDTLVFLHVQPTIFDLKTLSENPQVPPSVHMSVAPPPSGSTKDMGWNGITVAVTNSDNAYYVISVYSDRAGAIPIPSKTPAPTSTSTPSVPNIQTNR